MSEKGQKRRSKSLPATSDLPPSTDIIRPLRLVRLVQKWRSRELQMQHSLTAKHLLPHKRRRKFARRANQQNLSSPLCKNISLNPSGKSLLEIRPSHPTRGGSRVVTNARWDAMDATAAGADGVGGGVFPWAIDRGADERRCSPSSTKLAGWYEVRQDLWRRWSRTAKSCRSDARSWRQVLRRCIHPTGSGSICHPPGDGGKRARLTEESAK